MPDRGLNDADKCKRFQKERKKGRKCLDLIGANIDLSRRTLFRRGIEQVDAVRRLPGERDGKTSLHPAELVDRLDVVVGNLDLLEVRLDSLGRDRLGNGAVSADLGPGQDDLRRRRRQPLGNALNDWVLDGHGFANEVVAEGRIGRDVDALLTSVLNDAIQLVQPGMALDLVDGGRHSRGVDQSLQVRGSKVGDADGADLGLGEFDHGFPRINNGNIEININLTTVRSHGKWVAIGLLESHGPVNQVEVEVLQLELVQSIFQRRGDISRAVLAVVCEKRSASRRWADARVPQLGGDKNVLTPQPRQLSKSLLDGLPNFLLVSVDLRQV